MTVFVTGGTGFIGGRLMPQLIDRFGAASITLLSHTASKPHEAAAAERFRQAGVTVIEGDLTQAPISASAPPPRVDLVFHLGANIDTDTPEEEHRVNDAGTANLLAWLGESIRGGRLVYTSSIAVHDRAGIASGPITETSPYTPRTAYGVTKLGGERIIQDAAARLGYTWTINRLPTVYGPGGKQGGMFDLLITGVQGGGLISRVNWPGKTSVIFVDDVGAILIDLGVRADAANEIYCLGSGEDVTLADIATDIAAVLARRQRPLRVPGFAWSVMRRVAWSPLVGALVPRRLHVTYWRLTLVVDDGFWYDARKFLSQNRLPLVMLPEGLRRTLETESGAVVSTRDI
ncbi:MAG TPA: NAD-dependent epimerase/dehydratase family protein [Vicinamibacterales bacterium]|jgi:UDP-glucose 4-epimerase